MAKVELDESALRQPPALDRRYKIWSWYGRLLPEESAQLNTRVETIEASGLVAELGTGPGGRFVLYAARRRSP